MPITPRTPIGGQLAHGGGFGTLMTAAEKAKLAMLPMPETGEGLGIHGGAANERNYILGRSPGMFTVKVVEGGEAVTIGEDWIGPGTTAASGGLEGCSARRPGLCFMPDGSCYVSGGTHRKTAAAIADEAGTGPAVLVAVIPVHPAVGVPVFRAVALPDPESGQGTWLDIGQALGAEAENMQIVPIATLSTVMDGAVPAVADVHWTLEAPAIPLGPVPGSRIVYVVLTAAPDEDPYYRGTVYGSSLGGTPLAAGERVELRNFDAVVDGVAPQGFYKAVRKTVTPEPEGSEEEPGEPFDVYLVVPDIPMAPPLGVYSPAMVDGVWRWIPAVDCEGDGFNLENGGGI